MKKLGLGCMRFPVINEENKNIDVTKVKEMVDIYLSNGFTYFDTAYPYHEGNSERILKEALTSRYDRNKYILTSKCPIFSINKEEDIDRIFNEQLEKLGVDYLDYYLLHATNLERYEKAIKLHVFDHFKKYKEAGKIKHIGFSFHDSSNVLEKILKETGDFFEVVQLQINYLDWDSAAIESRKCYELCVKYGKKVIVMEPLKGGTLVNIPESAKKIFSDLNPSLSVASYGIRFCASLDNVIMVLSGMSNKEQLEDNISYMKEFKKLSEEEYNAINKVKEIILEKTLIPCTDCKYCVKGCPMKINIPKFFKMANEDYRMNTKMKGYYTCLINEGYSKASSCIKCGKCEKACPQHLKIRELLKDVIVKNYEE